MLALKKLKQSNLGMSKLNYGRSLWKSFWKSFTCCWRESITECVGTYILVFAGTGAIMVNTITQGSITHLGISFVFGAVVAALIYAIGHISQAHLNPAVTLAFWTSGFFPFSKVLPYVVAQFIGAIAASATLLLALGRVADLGATRPFNGNWMQSLILETILTFILMFVIFGSGLDRRSHNGFAGVAIGLTIGLEAAFMGPITGGSMNPARSLGPALVGGIWQDQWVYLVAPVSGAQLAVLIYGLLSRGFQDTKQEKS